MRSEIDTIVDSVSLALEARGHGPLPKERYDYYRKSDEEIMQRLSQKREEEKKRALTTSGSDGEGSVRVFILDDTM